VPDAATATAIGRAVFGVMDGTKYADSWKTYAASLFRGRWIVTGEKTIYGDEDVAVESRYVAIDAWTGRIAMYACQKESVTDFLRSVPSDHARKS